MQPYLPCYFRPLTACRVESFSFKRTTGLHEREVLWTRNRFCQHWQDSYWSDYWGKLSLSNIHQNLWHLFHAHPQHLISFGKFCLQFARGPDISSYSRMALEALISGFKMHLVKPMLVAEIRRIFPTAVGLPMEVSFYTAGVAAAAVECKHICSLSLTC